MSTAKVLSTKFITTITKGNRVVEVGYVDTTDVWNRVFLSEDVKRKFTRAAEAYIDTLRPDTSAVALQYVHHVFSWTHLPLFTPGIL